MLKLTRLSQRLAQHRALLTALSQQRNSVVAGGAEPSSRPQSEQLRTRVAAHGLATAATSSAPTANTTAAVSTLSYDDFDVEVPIAFELIQGALVRWSAVGQVAPPTVVLAHGILGNRRNMQSFAKMIAERFPAWQVLLVDLRCHGDSAPLTRYSLETHSVSSAAADVLRLLRTLKLFPHVIMGHSFGGKVVLSMAAQFGGTVLPRPVQAWVLDSLPGDVRSGDADGQDHPGRLIDYLRSIPVPITGSRFKVIDDLKANGFSEPIARWVVTNLRPTSADGNDLGWSFDLDGIACMYSSYERDSLWPLLERPPQGLKLDFVKAERSEFRWGGQDEQDILRLGHRVHTLRNAGHWVHTDNPTGLFDIIAPSFNSLDLRISSHARH